jgi:quercetin dioxygenase-like cupin family protein
MKGYRVEKWSERSAPVAGDLMDRMRSEGYSVFQWSDSAGAIYPEHEHGDNQSHWIISGSLELTVRGYGKVTLGAGDRDFMPARTVHAARVIGNEPAVYLIGAKN